MSWISDDMLDAIRSSLRIEQIVGEHVDLRRAGRQFSGRCIFHPDKTPSLAVDPEKKLWFCHGACHEGGDVFSFVERVMDLDFPGAVKYLARRAGIALDDNLSAKEIRRAKQERERKRQEAEALADVESSAWRETRDAILRLEELRRNAGRRLDAIYRGEAERWPGEDEAAWQALADVYVEMPQAAGAYSIMSFASPAERYTFALEPHRRREMVDESLDCGWATNQKGYRHTVLL